MKIKMNKACYRCDINKDITEFAKRGTGHMGVCKECRKVKYPYDPKKHRASHLLNRYNLQWQHYLDLYKDQAGTCAICTTILYIGELNSIHVDHDHDTGSVRGLLCSSCNWGLGHFQDSPTVLIKALEYLNDRKGK